MIEQEETNNTMVRYLLGEMSDQERASFEDQYQVDSDLFYRLVELENDLIDLYASGALSEMERKRLEHSFLADPDRTKRLAFAETLAGYPGAGSEGSKPSLPESRTWSLAWLRSEGFAARALAIVCLTAMLTGVSWLLVVNHNLRKEVEALRDQQVSAAKREQDLRRQLDVLTDEQAGASGRDPGTPEPRPASTIISFAVQPDTLRGNESASTLTIPHSATLVEFHLMLHSHRSLNYGLSLETADGNTVWHKENTKSISIGDRSTRITTKVPARILKTGDYVFRITMMVDQEIEDAAGYTFHVIHH